MFCLLCFCVVGGLCFVGLHFCYVSRDCCCLLLVVVVLHWTWLFSFGVVIFGSLFHFYGVVCEWVNNVVIFCLLIVCPLCFIVLKW